MSTSEKTSEKRDDAIAIEREVSLQKSSTSESSASPVSSGQDEQAPENADSVVYPSTVKLILLTTGLALVIFTVALEDTIIATAIPTITTVFDSLDDVGWYGSAFLLTTTSLQASFGKIYTYFDVKWTYLLALITFEVGSVVCAAATSSAMLIVGRAIAGVGASALFSGGMTIIGFSVPLSKMPVYISILASMYGIASVVGPVLGGALTDHLTWRWCFWINVPFGAVAFIVIVLFFKTPRRELTNIPFAEKMKKVDLVGAVFLVGAIVCLLLALQEGGTTFPWSSANIWGLLLGFVLLLIVFAFIQYYRGDDATLPPRILGQRTVLAGAIYTVLFSMAFFTHIFYLPFYFQAVKGTSAEDSGIRSIPYLVSVSLGSVASGAAITKVGYYSPFMWAGAAIFAVGSGLVFTLQIASSTGVWIGYQIVAAAGFGLGMQVPFLAIQAVLDTPDMPTGNAIILFCSTLGGSISISIAQTIFSNTLVREIPKHTQGIDAHLIATSGATTLRQIVPADQLQGVLVAYMYSLQRTFILPIAASAVAFVVSFFMEWKSVKGKKAIPIPAA